MCTEYSSYGLAMTTVVSAVAPALINGGLFLALVHSLCVAVIFFGTYTVQMALAGHEVLDHHLTHHHDAFRLLYEQLQSWRRDSTSYFEVFDAQ